MTKRTVKSYQRGVSDPFQPWISKRMEEMRAKANADKAVNEYRESIGYQPGSRPVDIVVAIAGKLKVLAERLVS